ncbi:MAG TPA: AraC family transcriptional regulator [Candidatus Methylacidiphilales bacterium]|jgi:AraC-like DNA-binding protein|nr:AraC family transcriptional regulator [Candidatus Methylacidiphilales bacterium]
MISLDLQVRLNDPCGHISCGPGWCRTRENSLALRDAELWLVWKGRGWMRTRDRELELLPGFCALMRPGGIYDAGHDEANPLGVTYLHFDAWTGRPFSSSKAARLYRNWPEFFDVPDLHFYDSACRRIAQLFRHQPDVANALLRATLIDLLASEPASDKAIAAVTAEQKKKIAQLVVSIHAASGPLPHVVDLAREMHWSPAHFSRVFKLVVQQSPRDFLLNLRLSRARHLLAETSLSVGEIADRLDYSDLFFFSRQFKAKTGLSPRKYRLRMARLRSHR